MPENFLFVAEDRSDNNVIRKNERGQTGRGISGGSSALCRLVTETDLDGDLGRGLGLVETGDGRAGGLLHTELLVGVVGAVDEGEALALGLGVRAHGDVDGGDLDLERLLEKFLKRGGIVVLGQVVDDEQRLRRGARGRTGAAGLTLTGLALETSGQNVRAASKATKQTSVCSAPSGEVSAAD